MTSFADITTIGVGGEITQFVEPTSRVGFIEVVEDADSHGLPLLVSVEAPIYSLLTNRSLAWLCATLAVKSPCLTRPRR